jgi:tRNA(adenine34) deaminase
VTDPDGGRDERGMDAALAEARRCLEWDDVPVGAAVFLGEELLASAGNERERRRDPTAHAEILALRAAADRVETWRLEECTIYVTLEPCAMCAGALVLARMRRLVYGAADPKAGFAGSVGDITRHASLNHRLEVVGGVRERECSELLKAFFRDRRASNVPNQGAQE